MKCQMKLSGQLNPTTESAYDTACRLSLNEV